MGDNATGTIKSGFDDFFFVCNVPDCTFSVSMPNINSVSTDDLHLMFDNAESDFSPTSEEATKLHSLLGEDITCPLHGRDNLHYNYTQTIVDPMEPIFPPGSDPE